MFRFVRVDSHDLLDAVYRLRYQVFVKECGFVAPSASGAALEFDPHDRFAIHLAALDADGEVVGTLRLVLPSPLGLPIERYCDLPPGDGTVCAEISRPAVSRRYRRRAAGWGVSGTEGREQEALLPGDRRQEPAIALGLWRAMFQESLRLGVGRWYVVMEGSLRRLLARYGFAFEPMGEPFDWGGLVWPCRGEVPAIAAAVRAACPRVYRWFFAGFDLARLAPQLHGAVVVPEGGGRALQPA